ncbi:cation diffusion facilitator family transporter [Balneola sp. MJW-20]|uniref:cation diffusion facilitator family transporter n=1 Tax=Gracilimonas aurantiaca TaxID=3234185 RepID=UPI003465A9ED
MSHHGHHHGHHHHHDHSNSSAVKLWFSIFFNLVITIAEIVGGILSNSLALLSDAVHNLNDTASLGIALFAQKVSKKKANEDKTFGYKRAEIIGAFINLITLVIVALFLIKEGVERFFDPQTIDGYTMFWVAIIGLAGNVITAFLLFKDAKDSLNIRSAFIHIVSDALSSVGVIIGGWLILKYNWYIVDTILTVFIGGYILWHSYHLLRETINILMESTPDHINLEELRLEIEQIENVCGAHHVHVWRLDENSTLLESHVVIEEDDLGKMEEIKTAVKKMLHDKFHIDHSTLEFEFEPCGDHQHKEHIHI